MRAALLTILMFLAACDGADPDARTSPEESRVAAKAIADVDAATAAANAGAAAPAAAP